jgi:hypothetical protein
MNDVSECESRRSLENLPATATSAIKPQTPIGNLVLPITIAPQQFIQ